MKTWLRPSALAVFLLLFLASPALAAGPGGAAVFGDYWDKFLAHWKGVFQQQNGIVMGVLCVGAVALFIITRGKWQK
jgi:hypothetical protein